MRAAEPLQWLQAGCLLSHTSAGVLLSAVCQLCHQHCCLLWHQEFLNGFWPFRLSCFLFFPFKFPWPFSQPVGLLQEKMIWSDWCRMHTEFLPYAWGKETVSQSQKMRQINGQCGRVLNTQLSKENLRPDTELGMSWDQYLVNYLDSHSALKPGWQKHRAHRAHRASISLPVCRCCCGQSTHQTAGQTEPAILLSPGLWLCGTDIDTIYG